MIAAKEISFSPYGRCYQKVILPIRFNKQMGKIKTLFK